MYLLAFPQFFLKDERSDLFKDYTSHEVKLLYLNELCHSLSRDRGKHPASTLHMDPLTSQMMLDVQSSVNRSVVD